MAAPQCVSPVSGHVSPTCGGAAAPRAVPGRHSLVSIRRGGQMSPSSPMCLQLQSKSDVNYLLPTRQQDPARCSNIADVSSSPTSSALQAALARVAELEDGQAQAAQELQTRDEALKKLTAVQAKTQSELEVQTQRCEDLKALQARNLESLHREADRSTALAQELAVANRKFSVTAERLEREKNRSTSLAQNLEAVQANLGLERLLQEKHRCAKTSPSHTDQLAQQLEISQAQLGFKEQRIADLEAVITLLRTEAVGNFASDSKFESCLPSELHWEMASTEAHSDGEEDSDDASAFDHVKTTSPSDMFWLRQSMHASGIDSKAAAEDVPLTARHTSFWESMMFSARSEHNGQNGQVLDSARSRCALPCPLSHEFHV